MDDEKQLKKRFLELSDRAELRHSAVFSDFLNLEEQSVFHASYYPVPAILYGGFFGAERTMACFGCDTAEEAKEVAPIICVEIRPVAPKFADKLSHRDFLGTLMGLGIRRETIGDILIFDNIGYVFCQPKIADYILENVDRVRHTSVKCKITDSPPRESMALPEKQLFLVASLRADALVSAVYKLSRSVAQAAFSEGKVFINGKETHDTSHLIEADEILSVRGLGRFLFCGKIGETKKGKLKVEVRIFK